MYTPVFSPQSREIAPGVFMPIPGFGTFDIPEDVTEAVCSEAIRLGWRHFDCAINYINERPIGNAIRSSHIDRKDFFVTTKIVAPPPSMDPEETYEAVVNGVLRTGLDYVDLFLIHKAALGGPAQRKVVWQALERLQEAGKTRAIGVSNYGKDHLSELLEYCKVRPACNQIELHPWCQPVSHTKVYEEAGIQLVAFSPLARGRRLADDDLVRLAEKYSRDPSQILLRWSLQKGYIPIVKTRNPERMRLNLDIFGFQLSEEDMEILTAKDTGEPPEGRTWPVYLECI